MRSRPAASSAELGQTTRSPGVCVNSDAPVRRVGALDVPVAYCPDLEEAILPQTADILKAIRETARY